MVEESGKVSRRRLLTALVGGAAAAAMAVAARTPVAQGGHDNTNVFHLDTLNTFGKADLYVDAPDNFAMRVENTSETFAERTRGGIIAISNAPLGSGVRGIARATGENVLVRGVFGSTDSTGGTGVDGFAEATSGNTRGVVGRVHSTRGVGVEASANAVTGTTRGVRAHNVSTGGIGVEGDANASTGITRGVLGRSASPDGIGVDAVNLNALGVGLRVSGRSHFSTIIDDTILAGQSSKMVTDSRVNSSSQVMVTLLGDPGILVGDPGVREGSGRRVRNGVSWVNVAAGSFTVNLLGTADADVPFRAFIVEKALPLAPPA